MPWPFSVENKATVMDVFPFPLLPLPYCAVYFVSTFFFLLHPRWLSISFVLQFFIFFPHVCSRKLKSLDNSKWNKIIHNATTYTMCDCVYIFITALTPYNSISRFLNYTRWGLFFPSCHWKFFRSVVWKVPSHSVLFINNIFHICFILVINLLWKNISFCY